MFTSGGVSSEDFERFQLSLERCLAEKSFTPRFYARFILSSEEVAAKFHAVDLKRQASALRSSLYMILRAAGGHVDGMTHLEDIARTHSERGHDIPPHLYEHWLECLLATAAEADPCFDEEIAKLWRSILTPCIDVMIASHRRQ